MREHAAPERPDDLPRSSGGPDELPRVSGAPNELPGSSVALRRQLDELRLENQRLHAALDRYRFNGARQLLHDRARVAFWKARSGLRRVRQLLQRGSSSGEGNGARAARIVRPYHVQIRETLRTDRPRILHVIANFYTGGSSQLVVDLIERLGHRFEQEVLARDLPPVPAYTGFPLHHVRELDRPRAALDHLHRFRPHIVHVHYLGHRRDNYSTLDWRWYHQIFTAVEQQGLQVIENVNIPVPPYISPAVSHFVYVSDCVRHEFGRVDARNLTIHPGSNLTLFDRPDAASAPDDCVGMAYRLEGDKLDESAIDVFIEVVRRRPQTGVLIVGGGRYLDAYRQRVAAAGRASAFTFTDYVPYEDLPPQLAQMSMLVAPVHTESFGQVGAFAMGMAIPVVGYRVGALPEILGDDALLAPPGDRDRLADIVVGLLDDRAARVRIGAHNRQRARELFSVEAMVERYDALYVEALRAVRG